MRTKPEHAVNAAVAGDFIHRNFAHPVPEALFLFAAVAAVFLWQDGGTLAHHTLASARAAFAAWRN